MADVSKLILLIFYATCVKAYNGYDDIDLEVSSGALAKLLRAMVNQTKADTMTLPANATSIRENITDTFSCENRTYGYYADVDNECQIFHVCLPSATPSGRNVTYRWSFICPSETIFNQEVLVCTRPRDAIDCEESPMYYDVNMEFGKIPEEETNEQPSAGNDGKEQNSYTGSNQVTQPQRVKNKRKQKKQIMASLIERVNEELNKQYDDVEETNVEEFKTEYQPVLEAIKEPQYVVRDDDATDSMMNARLVSGRSLKWKDRKNKRGSLRFKADV